MKNKKLDELKTALKSVKCPNEMDEKILTNVYKKHRSFKPSIAIIGILIVSAITIGVVNAEEIVKNVYNFFITTSEDENNGYDISVKDSSLAEINYDADFPTCGNPNDSEYKECSNEYTKQEIENMLGIKILSNSLYSTEKYKLVYSIKNGNKIASLSFQLIDHIDDSKINEYENFNTYKSYITLNTKYAENYDNTLIEGGTSEYTVYHIDNLDEDALLMKSGGQYTVLYNITFIHDNIVYGSEILFKGSTQQNPEEVVTKYLESFIEK